MNNANNEWNVRDSASDRLFNGINTVGLALLFVAIVYPLLYIVSSSFSSSDAVISGKVWLWPVDPTLDGYKAIFRNSLIVSGFANSLFYMVVGTAVNVVMTVLAAYPLSRKDFAGRHAYMLLIVFTMMFDGGLIPRYMLIKDLGMLDTRWALIVPAALGAFQVIITRTYFKISLPEELLESAQMDGCSDFRYLWRFAIPLSAPIIAVISLFYAVGHWNQFFSALIYLKSSNLYPLQIVLNTILVRNNVDMTMFGDITETAKMEGLRELLKYSLIVISVAPMLVIYPFVQKHFVKGVMIGSLKG
ncbi:MAG: carbohydrate ABC transporter permease [Paenibacillaceae bacterium]|nr:carbohydrate ABC transporter permease [Paenibacillaceae bacterium]